MAETGKIAEALAVKILKKNGYKILERNFRSAFGEIDIIAQKNEYLVFVEVKYRASKEYGGGASAVDYRKQIKIRKTAALYLKEITPEPFVRFDVFLITGRLKKMGKLDYEIIENAFF